MTALLQHLGTITATVEASLADLEARNATNVARLDTLPAIVPKVVDTAVDTVVAGMVVVGLAVASKRATPAVGTATWPVTALKGRNATIVCGHFGLMLFSYVKLTYFFSIRWRSRSCFP